MENPGSLSHCLKEGHQSEPSTPEHLFSVLYEREIHFYSVNPLLFWGCLLQEPIVFLVFLFFHFSRLNMYFFWNWKNKLLNKNNHTSLSLCTRPTTWRHSRSSASLDTHVWRDRHPPILSHPLKDCSLDVFWQTGHSFASEHSSLIWTLKLLLPETWEAELQSHWQLIQGNQRQA